MVGAILLLVLVAFISAYAIIKPLSTSGETGFERLALVSFMVSVGLIPMLIFVYIVDLIKK